MSELPLRILTTKYLLKSLYFSVFDCNNLTNTETELEDHNGRLKCINKKYVFGLRKGKHSLEEALNWINLARRRSAVVQGHARLRG